MQRLSNLLRRTRGVQHTRNGLRSRQHKHARCFEPRQNAAMSAISKLVLRDRCQHAKRQGGSTCRTAGAQVVWNTARPFSTQNMDGHRQTKGKGGAVMVKRYRSETHLRRMQPRKGRAGPEQCYTEPALWKTGQGTDLGTHVNNQPGPDCAATSMNRTFIARRKLWTGQLRKYDC